MKKLLFGIVNGVLSKFGYRIWPIVMDYGNEYKENEEFGGKNLSIKIERKSKGGHFEWPNMIALNQAISCFVKDAKTVVNIGSGTGTFEWFAASKFKNTKFIASELDEECTRWCRENRQLKNIEYVSMSMQEISKKYGEFDLAIAVDVIEHVKDYKKFLTEFSILSNRAVITTPNKARDFESLIASPPKYYQHVREWTAGEFYWVLKMFYSVVELYSMPNPFIAELKKIGILSNMTPLIALCLNNKNENESSSFSKSKYRSQ